MNSSEDSTQSYVKHPEKIQDRLDFSHNHPNLDILDNLQSATRYNTAKLGDEIDGEPLVENIISGKTPRGIEYLEDGVPFLGAGNVQRHWLDFEDVSLIDTDVHKTKLSSSKLREGDVLITIAGTIGRCAVYDLEEKANINQAVAKVEVNEDYLIPNYLSLYLNSEFGQKGFEKYRHDVSRLNINTEEIQELPIIVPPLRVQNELVEKAVTKIDQAHSLRHQKSELLDDASNAFLDEIGIDIDEKRSMFFENQHTPTGSYSHFNDGSSGERLEYLFHHPDLEVENIVGGSFSLTRLKDICQEPIHRGTQPDYNSDGEIMVIKTAEVQNTQIKYDETRRVSEDFYNENPTAQIDFRDVLVSSSGLGSLGKIGLFDKSTESVVDGHISIVKTTSKYHPEFLVFYLRSYLGRIQFEKWFNGSSGQVELSSEDFGKFLVPSTADFDFEAQKEIAERITGKYEEALNVYTESDEMLRSMMRKFEEKISSI